jgi:oxalate decarboxylase
MQVSFSTPRRSVATDIRSLAHFKASFLSAPTRRQPGGWAREVTQSDFAIAEDIAGVNMRLDAFGVRELHWHQQAEWAVMLAGTLRLNVFDEEGKSYVADVKAGDLWYIPGGLPHSLQGLGPDGAEFLLAFDNGKASEFNTLHASDWMAHTPKDALAENFGLPVSAFDRLPKQSRWIFQGTDPGPLPANTPECPYVYRLSGMAPTKKNRSGSATIADSRNFKASKTVAAAYLTLHPGGMREMHYHPNADEWLYFAAGQGRATAFNTGPRAMTLDFRAGDVGYIKKGYGHLITNTGDSDLVYLEIFKSDRFAEVSLTDWLARTPQKMVSETFGLSAEMQERLPKDRPAFAPE